MTCVTLNITILQQVTNTKNTLDFNVQSSDYVLNDNIPVFLDFIHPAFLLLNNPGSNAIRAIPDS